MKERIRVLDGLRGIAILMVIWHHLFSTVTKPGVIKLGLSEFPFLPATFLANGWLGVNLFFIISGFVLYYPYVTDKRSFLSRSDWRKYYLNRARRLLPLYYISVLFGAMFIYNPVTNEEWVRHTLLMLTATFTFTNDLWAPPYNWVMWSLGVEIWFSILFPFLVILTNRFSVVKVGTAVALLAISCRYYGISPETTKYGPYLGIIKDSLLGRLDDFFMGMFIAWLWFKHPKGKSDLWSNPGVLFAGLGILFLASHGWDYFILDLISIFAIPLINNILLLGFFLIIMHLLQSPYSLLNQIVGAGVFVGTGRICYSLYLWHGVILILLLGAQRNPLNVLFYLFVTYWVSFLSYQYIENNKWFGPHKAKSDKN